MKKLILFTLVLLLLTACADRPNRWQETATMTPIPTLIVSDENVVSDEGSMLPTPTTEAATVSPTLLDASYPDALPVQAQLITGVFLLEDTDLALTPEQAAALLPDWQAFAEINASDDVTQEQVDPVLQQIQAQMTPEQNTAIADMQLGFGDLMDMLDSRGISVPRDHRGGEHTQIPSELVDAFTEYLQAQNP